MNTNNLQLLLNKNKQFSLNFEKNNLLMRLIISKKVENKKIRANLLDHIQVFSDHFQRTMLLRRALCTNPKFLLIAEEHLQEEFQHNNFLNKDRNNRPIPWDPILEATASWFPTQMTMLDEEEKTVLIHLVLEVSANSFFSKAHKVMCQYNETDYFKIHSEVDEKHAQMGIDLLQNLSAQKYERLLEIQEKGWSMLNAVCDQIAILSTHQPLAASSINQSVMFG